MFFDWTEEIREKLSQSLPGAEAWKKMTPSTRSLQTPTEETLFKAQKGAVLLLLYPFLDEPHLVLIKRQEYPGVHSGQISFPGGKIELADESPQSAALREANEETGIAISEVEVLGTLSNLFIPPSNFWVHPFVGRALKRPNFLADPNEVAQIIEVPVRHFTEPENQKLGKITIRENLKMEVPYYEYEGHKIWGATAIMLSEFSSMTQF